jgi:hypothetical protein
LREPQLLLEDVLGCWQDPNLAENLSPDKMQRGRANLFGAKEQE